MDRCSQAYYADMVEFGPTLEIYDRNSQAAARRVQELIEAGIEAGALRSLDGRFAGQLITLAIDSVLSGVLLKTTGLSAGQAYAEIADLMLHGLSVSPGPGAR